MRNGTWAERQELSTVAWPFCSHPSYSAHGKLGIDEGRRCCWKKLMSKTGLRSATRKTFAKAFHCAKEKQVYTCRGQYSNSSE